MMSTDESHKPNPSVEEVSRREVLTAGMAAVGLSVPSRLLGAPVDSPSTTIPQKGRGYFVSNGRKFIPRAQGFDATDAEFYEVPLEDPEYLEVWCYTDKLSYTPGEEVQFHTSTTGDQLSFTILRDGIKPTTVHTSRNLPGRMHTLPANFYEKGCGWPASYTWKIPREAAPGFYIVITRATSEKKTLGGAQVGNESKSSVREQEHGFFIRAAPTRSKADILFISSTCTWTAYNDWGGFSHYVGYNLPDGFVHAPRLSVHRPFAKGITCAPEGAPRKPHEFPIARNSIPRYPVIEFAHTRGYSKWFSNCGWATYEKPFVTFAEREGINLDYATQIDLHYDQKLLDGYKCVVFVGHCEYWTWEMREAIDRFVERGGNVARFAGNFGYQIRLEDEGCIQIAYKERAHDSDPVRGTAQSRRLTSFWEDPEIDWFGAETFGLNCLYGIYAHVGVNVPRGTGGFTVYRPEHWAFQGTDLYYGDEFGSDARIFGYEVDGLDFTFRDGLPYPTHSDRAPQSTQILAMSLASNKEADHGHRGSLFYYGDGSEGVAQVRYGKTTPDDIEAGARGSGMIVTFQRGQGMVFHAGSCEWVAGLKLRDESTEIITRNVLNRFIGKSGPAQSHF